MPPDSKTILKDECEPKPFPLRELKLDKRPDGFAVVIPQSVLNTIGKRGRDSMDAEVGGMLVGELLWDDGPYVRIADTIEGKYTDEKAASVTFTAETWEFVHAEMDRLHEGKKIVGWYHTHPGFGIFLSGMDTFIHENFFPHAWQLAYVYDPHSAEAGFFHWSGGELLDIEPLIIEDEPMAEKSKPKQKIPLAPTAPGDGNVPARPANTGQKSGLDTFLLVLILIMQILCFAGLVFISYDKWAAFLKGEI